MRSTFLATFFPPFFSLIIEHCIVCKLTFIRSRCSHDLNICLASYTQLYSCHSSMPIAYWHDVTVFSLFFSLLEVCIREWPPLFSSRCNAVMCKKSQIKNLLKFFCGLLLGADLPFNALVTLIRMCIYLYLMIWFLTRVLHDERVLSRSRMTFGNNSERQSL